MLQRWQRGTRQFQYLLGSAQFLDLALQGFDAIALLAGNAITHASSDLVFAHPSMQGLGSAPDLGRDREDSRPQAWTFAPALSHHAHSAFVYFREKFV